MIKKNDYILTIHLRERFIQRTEKKYQHLLSCCKIDCSVCKKLLSDSKIEADNNKSSINTELFRRILNSDENRSYINNTQFMSWYYEKYGYDTRFEFLVHENLLFVVLFERCKKIVVTCVIAQTHIAGKFNKRPKYNS